MRKSILGLILAVGLVSWLYSEANADGAQPVRAVKPQVQAQSLNLTAMKAVAATLAAQKCNVSGSLTVDPNDVTNGYIHYKGSVTFKALVALEGVNLWLSGPQFACTCVTCPKLSSHALGLKPEGKFAQGETRSYPVDCASLEPLSQAPGKGRIEYFVRSSPDASGGNFANKDCTGTFSIGQ